MGASVAAASIAAASVAAASIIAASIIATASIIITKAISAVGSSITSVAASAVITSAETNVRGVQDIVLEQHAEITVGCGETRIRVNLVCRLRCSVLENFLLVPPVTMLHLSHMIILESIAYVSRENCDSLLRSRLFRSVLLETNPLEGKRDGVAMLLLKYRLAHAVARAAVVGTLPRPNNCPDLALLRTHHTLRAITTILLAATVNRVTEATMLLRQTIKFPVAPGN
jgi:hypothetical protein